MPKAVRRIAALLLPGGHMIPDDSSFRTLRGWMSGDFRHGEPDRRWPGRLRSGGWGRRPALN